MNHSFSPDARENPFYCEIASQARNEKIGKAAGITTTKKPKPFASNKKINRFLTNY